MMSHLEPDDSSDSDGPVPETSQEEDASEGTPEESRQVRRSSRLAKKKGPSLKDWPVPKLLEALYRRNIPAPSGASHGELFQFAMRHLDVPDAAAVPPVTPSAASKKCTAKKKHGSRSSANASHGFTDASISIPAKRPRAHIDHHIQDPVLAALSNIQSSLNELDTRIHRLEGPSTSAHQNTSPQPGPPFVSPATTAPGTPPIVITPHRSLGTAVPAAPTGVPFIPPAAAVSPHLRAQILAGNDINLVKILLCSTDSSGRRLVDCGDVAVILKECDPRLSKNVTMAEFNVAFGVFRDVICEVYPDRRTELDTYLAIISDLAMSYGGTLFYEYHKSFSAKAALYIQKFNQRLDWSVMDLNLISRHFTGHQALSCAVCGSFSHTASLCPKTVIQHGQPSQVSQKMADKIITKVNPKSKPWQPPLCINFNENVCRFANCKFIHACSYCGDSHPRSVCPRRTRLVKKT